ncbi:MAG: RNA polymerase sigma factor [Patescibacteria group bacterium]
MITLQLFYDKLPEYLQDSFYKRLQKKIQFLNKHFKSHDQPLILRVVAEQFKNSDFSVKAELFHKNKPIIIKRNARTPLKALEIAFNDLKENILQEFNKEREHLQVSSRAERSAILNEAYEQLVTVVKTQDKEAFSKILIPLLKDLKQYVIRRIRFSQVRGVITPGTLSVDDIVQEVIEKAYEGFTSIPQSRTLEHWLFHIANDILRQRLNEEHFEATFESWEDLDDMNIENLDERLTVNFSGEPEHLEDLTEPTLEQMAIGYDPYGPEYRGAENYPENRISRENQIKKIVLALSKLPENERTIFDLYAMGQYSEKEIAAIHNIKVQEVREVIKRVQEFVKKELAKK